MRNRNLFFLSFIVVLSVLLSGCVLLQSEEPKATNAANGSRAGEPSGRQTDGNLTTQISPARDLTGEWEGLQGSMKAQWESPKGRTVCDYEGYFRFNLRQTGNQLAGTVVIAYTKGSKAANAPAAVTEAMCAQQVGSPSQLFPVVGTVSGGFFEFEIASGSGAEASFNGRFISSGIQGTWETKPDDFGSVTTGTFSLYRAT